MRRITTSEPYSIAVVLTLMAMLLMAVIATLAIFASSAKAQQQEVEQEKSILCHRTGSEENPFRVVEVDGSSIPGAHSGHGDFILGPASEFEGKTHEELEGACAEADPRTTTGDTAADDQYTTGDTTTTAKDGVISHKKIINIPKQKGIPSEKKIIDIPKQKVLVDTGGPPLLLLGAALMCLAGAGIVLRLLRR